jgi:hypothetical protein
MKKIKLSVMTRTISILLFSGIAFYLGAQIPQADLRPQFLFKNFDTGQVIMKNGQINETMLNYNTLTGKMIFIKDNKYMDLTNLNMVDTVVIDNRRFVPAASWFNEVLYQGKISLFARHQGTLKGGPGAYGKTSIVSTNHYLSNIMIRQGEGDLSLPQEYFVEPKTVYLVRKDNEWFEFYNEKQFLKIFPEKSTEIKNFIKQNRIRTDRPEDLVRLITWYNSLVS